MNLFPTPCLVFDAAVFDRATERVLSYARQHQIRVRSHFKSYKCLALAARHQRAGIDAFAVAKVSEAEVLVKAGVVDVTIAYPALGRERSSRIAELARCAKVSVWIESDAHAQELHVALREREATVGVWIPLDLGLQREGLRTVEQLESLLGVLHELDTVRVEGFAVYLGHLFGDRAALAAAETYDAINDAIERFQLCADAILQRRLPVSVGSTPALFHFHRIAGVEEMRVGTAWLQDLSAVTLHGVSLDEVGCWVEASVVSTPEPGIILLDAGSKCLARQSLEVGAGSVFGVLPEWPDARLCRVNEEIAWVDVRACASAPKLGERVRVFPVNGPLVVSAFDVAVLLEMDAAREVAMEGRGKFV